MIFRKLDMLDIFWTLELFWRLKRGQFHRENVKLKIGIVDGPGNRCMVAVGSPTRPNRRRNPSYRHTFDSLRCKIHSRNATQTRCRGL